MTDERWHEYQEQAREYIDEVAQQMQDSEELVTWNDHAFHLLTDLLGYREQCVHRLREVNEFVPLGNMVEA